jgi:hypothetical protein
VLAAIRGLGDPVPPQGSRSLEFGFSSETAGTFTGTVTIHRCETWHTEPTFGYIVCGTQGLSPQGCSI